MFTSIVYLTLLAASAFAQNIAIARPEQDVVVTPGQSVIVTLNKPNSLSGSEEVAVVIGLLSCARNPCPSPSDVLGSILYNGPYNPQYHEETLPPYQNITVQIPSTFANGTAQLGVAHINLIGAGLAANLQTLSQTITVA